MNASLKNILILLVILTFAFAGYYVLVQSDKSQMLFSDNQFVTDEMLANTQLFMERSATLSSVVVDTSVFDDEKFLTYTNFTNQLVTQPVGRENPFIRTNVSSN